MPETMLSSWYIFFFKLKRILSLIFFQSETVGNSPPSPLLTTGALAPLSENPVGRWVVKKSRELGEGQKKV